MPRKVKTLAEATGLDANRQPRTGANGPRIEGDSANAIRTVASGAKGSSKPAPAAVPTAWPATKFLTVTHDQLQPSPDNPRKAFAPEAMAELAGVIVARGLLEPIVAIHGATLHSYTIVDGERRWRAIGLAIADGRLPADWPIDVGIRDTEGDLALVDSLIANVQRADLTPLEEGEALHKLQELDGAAYATGKLAALLGRSERHVQLRLALVEKLAPKVQQALAENKIELAHARELAPLPAALQQRLAKDIAKGELRTADLVREIERERVPLSHAIFDTAPQAANIVKDAKGKQFFVDSELFLKLQREAAKDKAKELRATWAWAEFTEDYVNAYDYPTKSADQTKAGCLVKLDRWSGAVTVATGLVRRADPKPAAGKSGKAGKDAAKTAAAEKKAKAEQAKRQDKAVEALAPRLLSAIERDPAAAFRVLAFGLLTGFCNHGMARIDFGNPGHEAFDAKQEGRAGAWAKPFAAWTAALNGHSQTPEDRGRLWAAIAAISDREMPKLLAALTASGLRVDIQRGGGYGSPVKKIDPALTGLAALTGIDLPEPLAELVPKPKAAPAANPAKAKPVKRGVKA